MIGSVLPPDAVTSEASADGPAGAADASPEGTGLFPQELELIARAGPRRRAEFTTTRRCARTALAGLGLPPAPLLRGPRGEPLWPPGVVGSLTHCAGYRAAAVAWGSRIRSLGVDAEPHQELPAGIAGRIAHPEELAALGALPDGLHGGRLLFSAKESVFKAWFPLAQRWLGFEECRVELDVDGSVRASLLVPGPVVDGVRIGVLHGRWRALPTHVGTAIIVPAGAPSRRSPC
jgi:4'-phosphopantetheinyl transferase EntD